MVERSGLNRSCRPDHVIVVDVARPGVTAVDGHVHVDHEDSRGGVVTVDREPARRVGAVVGVVRQTRRPGGGRCGLRSVG